MKNSQNFFNEELAKEVQELRTLLEQQEIKHKSEIQALKTQYKKKEQELKENYERRIQNLKEKIAQLKSQLNTNFSNSSLPPSTDIFDLCKAKKNKALKEYNNHKKRKKKRGAQAGHIGKTRTKKEARELIESGKVDVRVEEIGDISRGYITRYIYDLEIRPIVRELHIAKGEPIIESLKNSVVYGENIRALVVFLFVEGIIAHKRVAGIINQLSGNVFKLSEGSSYNICREFSEACEPICEKIINNLKNAPVLMTDATSFKVAGKKNQIRNHSTERDTYYYAAPSKSKTDLLKSPILSDFRGILVHDNEKSFYSIPCEHAECNGHLIRYLKKSLEDTNHKWQKELIALFEHYNKKRNKLIKKRKVCFTEKEIFYFEKEYRRILDLAQIENQHCKYAYAQSFEKNIIKRLIEYKEAHVYFLYDFNVPFTNNLSERDLRQCVKRRKLIPGLHKFSGLEMYCNILSIKDTYKKRNIPLLEGIREIQKSFNKNQKR